MEKSDKIKLIRLVIAFILFAILFVCRLMGVFDGIGQCITIVIFIIPYLIAGYDVVIEAFENIIHGEIFDEAFLMMLASVGAFVIGEYEEAVAVMVFYQIGELLSDLASDKSRESIEELMNICPEWANVYRDGKIEAVDPHKVKISDVILIKAGERIPLDGIVVEGSSFLDTSALTGESIKRRVQSGDEVLSGCLNGESSIKIKVTKKYSDSTVARILEMVENTADKKSKTESFINRFARIYTPVVTVAALLLAIIPPLLSGGEWTDWVRRACTFLVISCPCALVISVPLCFFAGIGVSSSRGILIKGGNYLEMISNLKAIAFDKTGTITEGKFSVNDIIINESKADYSRNDILKIAYAIEQFSNHPIARSIIDECENAGINGLGISVNHVQEMPGLGMTGLVDNAEIKIGGDKLLRNLNIGGSTDENIDSPERSYLDRGNTVIHIVRENKLIASVIIGDTIKSTSAEAIQTLKREGIESCIMLTGDRTAFAENVAKCTGIDEVRAELLPDEKVAVIEEYIDKYHRNKNSYVAFSGDGINDAPSLMRADIGIAMGLGADAAIEAADIVLVDNNLMQIAEAIRISRKTIMLAKENIIFAISVKALILVLGAIGAVGMWAAVFADVGVALLAILNAMRVKH